MLLVIGLDGATFDLLRPWMEAGHLPVIAKIAAAGVAGPLESTLPPVTAPAWVSFMTGKRPEKHGVFDFFIGRAGKYRITSANDIRGKTLWDILSDHGRTVGVINVPITYPPRAVNGFLVPGLLSPKGKTATFPPDILAPYEQELGPYRTTPDLIYQAGNEDQFFDDLLDLLETRIGYAIKLAKEQPTNLLMVHFLVTDIAQHTFWKHSDSHHPWHDPLMAARYGNKILEIFQRADRGIGELIDAAAPTTTVILSDHGFGPLHGIVNLNLWLIDSGLMALNKNTRTRLKTWAFRSGASENFKKITRRFGLSVSGKLLRFEDVDWSRTTAYSMGHLGQVYLNLRGREPEGIVEPKAFDKKIAEVRAALQELSAFEGGPKTVEILPGTTDREGPDLHVILDQYKYAASPLFASDGKVISTQKHFNSGEHRREGIIIASGEGIREGFELENARIYDIAPTILYLMRVPVPDDMDGAVLERIITKDWAEKSPIVVQKSSGTSKETVPLTPSENALMEERLRGLGYMGAKDD